MKHAPTTGTILDPDLSPEISGNGHAHSTEQRQSHALNSLEVLWDRRRTLLRFACFGFLLALIVAFLIPTKYDSTTQLMPPDNDSSGAGMLAALASRGDDALGGYASSLLGMKSSGALFIGVLRSRTVEDAVINRFDLRRMYGVRRMEDARTELEQRTFIAEDRKSGIITITVRDHNPQHSQAMAQSYVDELNTAVATLSTSAARREREFLETRLAAVKQDLDQAARDFSQFASKNTTIDISEQGRAMVEAAARIQGEIIAAEAQRQGLEQIYSANNARVRAVQANIDELRRQLNNLGGAGPTSDAKNSLYPSIRELPLLGVTYSDLYRRTKIQEAVFETLTKQYELAKVQEAKEIPTVKVLDPPSYPEKKSSPKRLQIMVVGFVMFFVAGCFWILGTRAWNGLDDGDPRKALVRRISAGGRQDWEELRGRASLLFRRGGRSKDSEGFPGQEGREG